MAKEFLLFSFSICLVLLLLWISSLTSRSQKKIKRRMDAYLSSDKAIRGKQRLVKDKSTIVESANRLITERMSQRKSEKIRELIKSSGSNVSLEEFMMLRVFCFISIGGLIYLIYRNIFIFTAAGILGYMLPKLWITRKRNKRIQSFNEQLPDMITTIIGSLRSGYSFQQALKTVSEESESPVKEEIATVIKEMSYGATLEEALNSLQGRMPSDDLEIMIQAVLIQRQVGGNLSLVLEIIVKTIRERIKLARQVKTLTAQGRLSGRIIGGLPIVLGFTIYLINPDYISSLFTNTIGIVIVSMGVISSLIGFFLISKITKIEV